MGAVGLLSALAMPTHLVAQEENPRPARYTVTDLGTLGGPGTNSTGFDMNNAGWVAGSGNLIPGGPQHAFLWYGRGPLFDLGTLGGPNSGPGGPNARGEASILSETSEIDPNGEDFCGFGNHLQCLAGIWRNRANSQRFPPCQEATTPKLMVSTIGARWSGFRRMAFQTQVAQRGCPFNFSVITP